MARLRKQGVATMKRARLPLPLAWGEQPVRGTRIRHAGGMAKGQRTPGRCFSSGDSAGVDNRRRRLDGWGSLA